MNGGSIDQLSLLFNVAIVAGYLIVPMTALRLIPMRWWIRAAGVVFFLTCATTHLYMAFAPAGHHNGGHRGWLYWFMLLDHAAQSVAVWTFVLGLAAEVRHAVAINHQRWATPIAGGLRDRFRKPE